ncbi:MAG: SDR family oxidoreductase [Alphaproteobacteria bacterium]|nr:SDR family oxidoreductase [Alphaproteobacteria bacterium]
MQSSSNRPLALVTGASSGIGAALARELARHGHDLVLSARRREPMETLAAELRRFGAEVRIVPADLAAPGGAAALVAKLGETAVDVLINNAGLGANGPFARIAAARHDEIMQVNIVALTELTQALLPGMLARRRGTIVLVSSTASFLPCPNMAVYAASKAYIRHLGEALAQELKGTGVAVNVLCPGATATEFFAIAGGVPTGLQKNRMMSADKVARIGYAGLARGARVTVAGWINRILAFVASHGPHAVTLPLAQRTLAQD